MKRVILSCLVFILVLTLGVMFSSCKKNEDVTSNEPIVETFTTTTSNENVTNEEAETVYVVVTDESGEGVSDQETQENVETENDTKEETTAYSVMGGSDPYVYDIF